MTGVAHRRWPEPAPSRKMQRTTDKAGAHATIAFPLSLSPSLPRELQNKWALNELGLAQRASPVVLFIGLPLLTVHLGWTTTMK
jgi:hypothetical protein